MEIFAYILSFIIFFCLVILGLIIDFKYFYKNDKADINNNTYFVKK